MATYAFSPRSMKNTDKKKASGPVARHGSGKPAAFKQMCALTRTHSQGESDDGEIVGDSCEEDGNDERAAAKITVRMPPPKRPKQQQRCSAFNIEGRKALNYVSCTTFMPPCMPEDKIILSRSTSNSNLSEFCISFVWLGAKC